MSPSAISSPQLSALFGITEEETQTLAKKGVIKRSGNGYSLIESVKSYVYHLQKINDDDASHTQQQLGENVGISERSVREVCDRLALDSKKITRRQFRLAYISDIREKAAGRGGDAQQSLTAARTSEAEASTELKRMLIAEKAGLLVPVEEIEPLLLAMVTAARTELLALPNKLVAEIKALTGAEVDAALIEERIHESLNHLATSLQQLDAGDDDESGAFVEAAAEADDD